MTGPTGRSRDEETGRSLPAAPGRLSTLLLTGFAVLLLNAMWLVAAPSASLGYVIQVVAHPLLGLALAAAAGLWLRRRSRPLERLALAGLGWLAGGLLLGCGVLVLGATRPYEWLLDLHVSVSAVGAVLLAAHLWRTAPSLRLGRRAVRSALVALALGAVLTPVARAAWDADWRQAHRIVNPLRPPATMEGEGAGPDSPFFPSSARTNTGDVIPADFFLTSETCGRCHRDIYEQWNSSAHHFSSFNNQWYRRSIEYMQDVVGTRPSKWCAGCHDHAVFFNGRFDRPIREQIDTPEAQAGLGCTSCHSIVHVGGTMGQGDFTVEYPPLHDLAASEAPLLRWAHDLVTELAPEPHRRTFLKPFHREDSAEFCSTCHKVHLDVPVNGYRWIRGFNEYDNWQASGVSGQGARSFYYPETPLDLQRLPHAAGAAPTTRRRTTVTCARTASRGRTRRCRSSTATRSSCGSCRTSCGPGRSRSMCSGSRGSRRRPRRRGPLDERVAEPRLSSTFAVGEESARFGAGGVVTTPAEVVAPLDLAPVPVRRGESVRVEVVVRTRGVGHFFPGRHGRRVRRVGGARGGRRPNGRVLLHSGAAADGGSGPVDPGAHFYRSLQLDAHGNPDQQAQRLDDPVGCLRPADSARRRRHRPLPACGCRRMPATASSCARRSTTGSSRGGTRSGRSRACAIRRRRPRPPTTTTRSGGSPATRATSPGPVKAIPDIPTTVMAGAEAIARCTRRGRAAAGGSRGSRPRRCASAGTTMGSVFCCKVISAAPRRRSGR